MRKRPILTLILVFLLLPLLLVSCRRDEEEATPTVAPTAVTPEEGTSEAQPVATTEPAPEAVGIDPQDIDWPPQVVSSSPVPGAEIPLDSAISIRFDQPMDQSSVEQAFQVDAADAGGDAVQGQFDWPRTDTVVFSPETNLDRNLRYRVRINEGARGQNGQALQNPVELAFQTSGFLEVAQVIPGEDVEQVAPDGTITVIFNRPVVPLVSTSRQSDLPQPLEIEPQVAGSGRWVSTSIYRFTPDVGFAAGTEYEATVPAGLEDVTGGVLENAYSWQFTTARPSVASIEPATGATDVIPTRPLTVTFSTPMEQDSTESAVALEPAHPLQFEWSDDNRILIIRPEDRLELETTYTLSIGTSASAASGESSLDRETSAVFDTVPFPAVRSTSPPQGQEALPFRVGVSIEFASPMDPETIEGRLSVSPEPEEEVDTFISPNGQHVSLNFELEQDTGYEITIPGDVADPYGNTLGEDYTWSFRTAPPPPLASINLPATVGQFSNSFPTEVAVVHRNVSSLNAALYDLGLPVNLLVEPSRANDFNPGGQALRTWSLPADAPANTADQVTLDLGGGSALPTGVYYLSVSAPELNSDDRWWQNQRSIIVVGDTNLVVKETFNGVHVWATELATGDPAADRSLTLYDVNGNQVGTTTTDEDGLATFDHRPAENYFQGVLVVSGTPGQSGFGVGSSTWQQGVSPWDFGLQATSSDEQPFFAYIYTDRPIYRPGDTVQFRGILRDANYGRYDLPATDTVRARVEFASFYEPQQTVSYSTTLSLDETGTFNSSFDIPADASLGQYRIVLADEGNVANASRMFTVADYRAPEFTVSVTPSQEETLRGETVDVTIEARYLFGAPAADLPVQWTIRELPYSFPWEGPYYSFDSDDDFYFQFGDQMDFFGRYVTDGAGRTDADGRLTVTLPADLLADAEDGSRRVTIEATIRDISDFPVTASGDVIFHAAETYVGVSPQNYLNSAGTETNVDLVTVDWEGNPMPTQDVDVVFYEREYEYIRDSQTGIGNWEPNDTEVDRVQVTTDGQGEAQAAFTPEEGGTYRALASVEDEDERTHESSTLFWVSAADFVAWRTNPEQKRMDLTPDQRTYEVGDTARILVQSPFEGSVNAWLTIERGTLLEQRLITLETNSDVLEIPITEDLSPNAFVSVVAVRGPDADQDQYADIRLGITELVVPPEPFSLNVELTPRSDVLAPGETVTYDVRVTDYMGQPVQADLSLALVDLAVLTLKEDNAPNIVDAFYERQAYRSQVGSGLFVSGEGLAVEVPEQVPGLGGGGGGGAAEEAARALQEEDDVRRDFPDTAYWRASLSTDENGEATVEIPLPDSLTTWRLSSKAVSQDSRVGQSSVDIVATLPLLVRPVTPRFLTVNDVVQLGAIVNNNSDQSLDVTVSLEAEGVTLADDAQQEVTIPAGRQQLVRWQATVEDVTHVDLTFRAEGGEYSDATKPTFGVGPDQLIPVYRYDAEDIVGTSGLLEEAGRQVEAVLLPPQVDNREGAVDITLSASLAAAVTEALDAVEDPDIASMCAHSVVSHFLPNLATVRALRSLGLEEPDLETGLDQLVMGAISRLAALQKGDGGWGWCYAQESDDVITSYVLFGLAKAQQAGYDTGTIDLERAINRLVIRDPQQLGDASEVNRQAWFLYVRAELRDGDVADLDALFDEHRELLDPYAKAYLALAYEVLGAHGDNNQQALLSDLSNSAVLSATGAHWEDAEVDRRNLSSDIRGTAVVIDALARIEPESALAPQAVRWLMSARTAGHWPTPFETSWSILALTDWMLATGELEANYDYALNVNGREVQTGHFDQENVTASTDVSVPMRNLLTDETNYFIFQREEGPGRLYYTTHLDAFVNAESVEAINRGMSVQRVYYDAACDPEEETCEPIAEIEAGQRVRVEITLVAPNDLTYLRLEDPIPAGAEAVDPGLQTSASGLGGQVEEAGDREYRYGYWGWWTFNRIEYRDEKVVFYSDFVPAGTYQYTYYLETPIPGQFQVRPAIAYEEFFPEVFGRSNGARFTIEE